MPLVWYTRLKAPMDVWKALASWSADQLAKAFHTSIGAFNLVYHTKGIYNALFGNVSEQSGATPSVPFYAATQPLYLPASIAGSVNGITGLDGAMAAPQIM